MATHYSSLAWKIPKTEEPGGLQSMGCKELDTTEQLTMHTGYHYGYIYHSTGSQWKLLLLFF